jgi:hypothetical protein
MHLRYVKLQFSRCARRQSTKLGYGALRPGPTTSVIGRFSASRHLSIKTPTVQRRPLTFTRTFTSTYPKMSRPLSLFSIQAILVLAIDDGSRILTKYYSNPHPPAGHQNDYPGQIAYKTVKDQKAFEKGLLGG